MSTTIGVMIGNANSPYTIDTINGIREAASQAGVNVINFIGVHSSYYNKGFLDREVQEEYDYQSTGVFAYDKLCDIDALIVAYGSMTVFMTDKELTDFNRKIVGIPTVYLENVQEGPKTRYIVEDSYAGMKQVMEHMIEYHGYEKILYLGGPKGNFDADERMRAYKDSMINAGLSIDSTMIQYGDFSERVEDQVNRLLDLNPDAEALVCANDLMAIAAYDVIKAREKKYINAVKNGDKDGIERYKKHIVGEASEFGIAISGYDNVPDSANTTPPLTTVAQSPFSHGFMALNAALKLLDNDSSAESIKVVPKLVCRQSCGCKVEKHHEFPALDERFRVYPEQYAATLAEIYTNAVLPVEFNDALSEEVYQTIYNIILKNLKNYLGISSKRFSADDVLEDIKLLLNGPIEKYIPRMTFVTVFNDLMVSILKNVKQEKEREILIDAQSKISDFIYSKLLTETRDNLMTYRHRTWFMPLISRDMANSLESIKDMYLGAMSRLEIIDIGDVYLFVTDEAIVRHKNDRWECPNELKLVAFTENGKVTAYDLNEAPVISKENVLNEYIKGSDDTYNASILNLYSGEYQYGIIVAKLPPEDVLSLYCASVQISTSLKYCEAARYQQKAQKELEHIIKEVEDKNEILRSLSEFDDLTGCYNRRGFLENGLNLIKENVGKEACVVFADLDHLKEINDRYGHSEGDFAIEHMAKNMKSALPDSAILARLGGDEFVAIFILDENMDAEILVKNIANTSVAFNAFSAKPYYVECSAGYKTFVCEDDTSLEDVMGMADEFLYEAKIRRRKSIVRKITIL